jgi:acyl dehydratase
VKQYTAEEIRRSYGEESQISEWLLVEQKQIDQFGHATLDSDWMHVDPERAKRDGPFEGTIAFGFWTLSMLTYFVRHAGGRDYPDGALYGLNYGFDRVRLIEPVVVGKRIRNRSKLLEITERGAGRFLVKTENTVEIEGSEKPAMVAEWLVLLVYPTSVDAPSPRNVGPAPR